MPNEVRIMNIRKKISTLAIAAALVCGIVFATDAIAQNNGPQSNDQYNQNYTTQMTPEQQTALQQILKEHSDVTGQIEEAINAKRGELLAQLDSTNPDRAKIASLSRELGDLRGQLLTARVDMKAKLAQLSRLPRRLPRLQWLPGFQRLERRLGIQRPSSWRPPRQLVSHGSLHDGPDDGLVKPKFCEKKWEPTGPHFFWLFLR